MHAFQHNPKHFKRFIWNISYTCHEKTLADLVEGVSNSKLKLFFSTSVKKCKHLNMILMTQMCKYILEKPRKQNTG